jgi:hypothetical protein
MCDGLVLICCGCFAGFAVLFAVLLGLLQSLEVSYSYCFFRLFFAMVLYGFHALFFLFGFAIRD